MSEQSISPPKKKVCVLGLGYIGLPTASILANRGFSVSGVDVQPKVVETINRGAVHIVEPGLATLVQAAVNSGNLRATSQVVPADYFMICVPTPFRDRHRADLSFVDRAVRSLLPVLTPGNVLILESTVPPGVTQELVGGLVKEAGFVPGEQIFLAYCPERVLPGRILEELVANDRIIGGWNKESAEKAQVLYSAFVEGEIFLTDSTTAEMVKLVENSFRDVNIAFANELMRICKHLKIEAWEVIKLANRHPRVKILSPGPGVGGHCIAVDPWFIVEKVPQESRLIRTAREVNDGMPEYVVEQVSQALKGKEKPEIAVLGLTYKADVDDRRESPALKICQLLARRFTSVRAYDPYVEAIPGESFSLRGSWKEAVDRTDCVLLLVAHREFKGINPEDVRQRMRGDCLLDFSGIWRPKG